MVKTNKTAKYTGILHRYLEKLGLRSSIELDAEERVTYQQWEEILTSELTIESLVETIRKELDAQNQALRNAVKAGDERAAQIAVARIENYETLVSLVERRERSRDELAEHINRLIDV